MKARFTRYKHEYSDILNSKVGGNRFLGLAFSFSHFVPVFLNDNIVGSVLKIVDTKFIRARCVIDNNPDIIWLLDSLYLLQFYW